MLMRVKAQFVDFAEVAKEHREIHERLENWASWVMPRQPHWIHPMWRFTKSNAFQWHPPEIRKTCDTKDAALLEKAVYQLPSPECFAVRWCYVYRTTPSRACRIAATNHQGLMDLIKRGRQMLINRSN